MGAQQLRRDYLTTHRVDDGSIGAEGDGLDGAFAVERGGLFSRFDVPDDDAAVILAADRHQILFAGRKSESLDFDFM